MENYLSKIEAPKGAKKARKRIGRGESSGWGKTAGKGAKGQKARSGGYHKMYFEGGQTPLMRRLPKMGFNNVFKKSYAILNLRDLSDIPANTVVDSDYLLKAGKIKKVLDGIKILGVGDLKHALTIKASRASTTAKDKIEKAGGKLELL